MRHYDICIIGGGIHGAGVAQAASAAGFSVLLLEKTALASGTSSRSSKLIHGGLRYLESGQFRLVRNCLHEREILLRIAPGLVQLKPFFIPVYQHSQRRPWQIRSGLTLYALLSGLQRSGQFRKCSRREWTHLDGLKTENLQAVFQYYDAQTDDAALTRAVMKSAQSLGAELCMPARLIRAELKESGNLVHYEDSHREHECCARVVINAGGPWANEILGLISPAPSRMPIELVQGSHIIVNGQLHQGIFYLEAPSDRRAVFAMPWHDKLMVGTTETPYYGDPAMVSPLDAEIDYLLTTLGYYFPAYSHLSKTDIDSTFAGLRVLPSTRQNVFFRSRETMLLTDRHHRPRLLSILGGKLTDYRATSEKIIRIIAPSLPEKKAVADTRHLMLTC